MDSTKQKLTRQQASLPRRYASREILRASLRSFPWYVQLMLFTHIPWFHSSGMLWCCRLYLYRRVCSSGVPPLRSKNRSVAFSPLISKYHYLITLISLFVLFICYADVRKPVLLPMGGTHGREAKEANSLEWSVISTKTYIADVGFFVCWITAGNIGRCG